MEQTGSIIFEVTSNGGVLPVPGATASIFDSNGSMLTTLTTDASGRTPEYWVAAPAAADSQAPGETAYYKYSAEISAENYAPVRINGISVFPGIRSVVPVELAAQGRARGGATIVDIPDSALLDSTPREPEAPSERERILTSVYIPATITVHLGRPDSAARNVVVSFPDYIKNVASSEIYPTWPESALRANIYAQIGFALNRVFTEWYTSRGYNFNITNSTSYDQSFVEGRNIFANISELVDEIFNIYPRRQGRLEPLFASYCNGSTVTCNGLSQWGTVSLANQGYTPLMILRYYYGNDVELVQTNDIRGIEGSYPGYVLRQGSSNEYVKTLQNQLIRVSQAFPAIPRISSATGYFGTETLAAVRAFQKIFNLTVDGLVGKATWYALSYIYASVKNLADIGSEGETRPGAAAPYPGFLLRQGSRGSAVRTMQGYLNDLSKKYSDLPSIAVDGVFGPRTLAAVRAFQRKFGLTVDGIVGRNTWSKLASEWESR